MLHKTIETVDEYIDRLIESGWKELGSGSYARVLSHKNRPGVVLRVSGDPYDKWPIYRDMVAKSKNRNPYFPIFGELRKFEDENGEKFVVSEVERLYQPKKFDFDFICSTISNAIQVFMQQDYYKKSSGGKAGEKGMNPLLDEKLLVACQNISSILVKDEDIALDMHDGNIMCRRNGQIVITDPIC